MEYATNALLRSDSVQLVDWLCLNWNGLLCPWARDFTHPACVSMMCE